MHSLLVLVVLCCRSRTCAASTSITAVGSYDSATASAAPQSCCAMPSSARMSVRPCAGRQGSTKTSAASAVACAAFQPPPHLVVQVHVDGLARLACVTADRNARGRVSQRSICMAASRQHANVLRTTRARAHLRPQTLPPPLQSGRCPPDASRTSGAPQAGALVLLPAPG